MANRNGTGFTNFSDYQKANQNNGLADTLANGVNDVANQTQQDLGNQSNQFNQQAGENNYNTEANSQYVNNTLNNAQTDPTKVTNQDYTNFDNYRTGHYNGPTGLSNTGQLQNEANQAQQYGNELGSANGRLSLLRNMIGYNGYSTGLAGLDSSLIGNNSSLANAKKNAQNQVNLVNQGINQANNTAQNYAVGNKNFSNMLNTQLGLDANGNLISDKDATTGNYTNSGAYQRYYNSVNDVYNKNLNDFNTNYGNISTDLSAGKLNNAESQAGLPDYGTQFGINPYDSRFLTENKPTLANSETQDQYDKLSALAKLAGQNNLLPTVDTNAYDPKNAIQFNHGLYDQAVMGGANSAATPLIQQLQQISAATNALASPTRGNLNGNITPVAPYQAPLQGLENQLNGIYGKIGKSWASNPQISQIIQSILSSGNFYDNTNGPYQPDQNPGTTGPVRGRF